MGLFDNFLKQVATGDQIKDYKHASRLFVDNNYALSPKYTWLFHVFFDLNPALTKIAKIPQIEVGMLVKSTDLPKFRIDTKVNNNYNRPSVTQSKIRYEDINITFHDDSSDVVRKLWYDYYNYYYRDMDNSYGDATGSLNPIYHAPNKQRLGQRSQLNKFGYTPRTVDFTNQYINAIRIYSLHQKRFSEYTLINPIITSFRHGNHSNGSDSTMENSMTISYETVLYCSGYAKKARGFFDLHYDKSPSPLTPAGGGTNSFAGPGGILNSIDEVINDASGGNFGGALFKAVRGYEKNKNVDLRGLAKAELTTALVDIASGKDPRDRTFIPYRAGSADNASAVTTGLNGATTAAAGSVSSNGSSLSAGAALIGAGVATALAGKPELGLGVAIAGLAVNAASNNQVKGGAVNKVVNLEPGANNLLNVVSAEPLPLFSFAAAIVQANEQAKAKSEAEAKKKANESADAYRNYYTTGAGSKTTAPTYESGTNNQTNSSKPTDQSPDAGKNYSAGSETSSQSAAEKLGKQGTAAGYAPASSSGGSTNPAPPQ